MVHCVLFTIELENDHEVSRFLRGFNVLQRFVLTNEPGTLTYELLHSVLDDKELEANPALANACPDKLHPRRFTVLERYSCKRDFEEVHLKSKTFEEFFALVQTLKVVGEPKLQQLSNENALATTALKEHKEQSADAPVEPPHPLVKKGVLILAGSRSGNSPAFEQEAHALGELIITKLQRSFLYGGGNIGLMGAAARSAKAAAEALKQKDPGSIIRVVAVIPTALTPREVTGELISDVLYVPETMSERKTIMLKHADMILALPGGFGTFDELYEYLTLFQLHATRVKIGLVNVNNFFQPFLDHLQALVREGFVPEEALRFFVVRNTAAELVDAIETFTPPPPALKLKCHDQVNYFLPSFGFAGVDVVQVYGALTTPTPPLYLSMDPFSEGIPFVWEGLKETYTSVVHFLGGGGVLLSLFNVILRCENNIDVYIFVLFIHVSPAVYVGR
eukprot:gene6788-4870_t